MREDVVEIGGNVGCCLNGLRLDSCSGGRRRESQRQRRASPFLRGKNKRELDRAPRPHEEFRVVHLLGRPICREGVDGSDSGLVALDGFDDGFPTSLCEWVEGRSEVGSCEETDVEELIFGETQVFEDGVFSDEGHGGVWKIDGEDEFVKLVGVEEGFRGGVDGVDVSLGVFLEVDELGKRGEGREGGGRGKEEVSLSSFPSPSSLSLPLARPLLPPEKK